MQLMKCFFLTTVSFLFFISIGYTYDSKYSPFTEGNNPNLYELKDVEYEASKGTEEFDWQRVYRVLENGNNMKITVLADKSKGILAKVHNSEMSAPEFGPVKVGSFLQGFDNLYTAALNDDSKPDIIIVSWAGSASLSASIAHVTFLLFSKDGYRVFQTNSYNPNKNCFLNIKGKCKFIHTSLIRGEKGRDGKIHNYWVYSLFGFSDNEIVPENHLRADFPKWIMYSFGPNHQETRQLTTEQKERLWSKKAYQVFKPID